MFGIVAATLSGMFEIAISPNSKAMVPSTRYDVAAGFQFQSQERAEQFCRELNHFCYQERFLVIRAGQFAEAPLPQVMKAAA